MKKFILLVSLVLGVSPFAQAGSELADLVLTHTLIRNQTILYKIESQTGEVEERASELFAELESDDDCKQFDLDGKYQQFRLLTVTEEPNKKEDPGFSQWVEGNKVEGFVTAKTTQLCFAL